MLDLRMVGLEALLQASGTDRPGSRRKRASRSGWPGDDDRRQRRFLVCRQPPRRVALDGRDPSNPFAL